MELGRFELEVLISGCWALEARLKKIAAEGTEIQVWDVTVPAIRKAEAAARLRDKLMTALREAPEDE